MSAYNNPILVQCENLQNKLTDVFESNALRPMDRIPFTEFLTSPANRNGINMEIAPGSGKVRTLVLTYFPRIAEADVTSAAGRNCETDNVYTNRSENYQIDTNDVLESGEKIDVADLSGICEDNPSYFAEVIMRHMDVVDRKVASRTSAEAALLIGDYSTYVTDSNSAFTLTGDALQVRTKDSSGNFVAGALENVEAAAQLTGFNSIVGFGGTLMNEHIRSSRVGCCTNYGLMVDQLLAEYGFAYGQDMRLAAALGNKATQSLIMEPGALQLLNYVQNPWTNGVDPIFRQGGYAAFATTTPAGIDVDVLIKDECPGQLTIKVIANTKLVAMPSDMFLAGDEFSGVNYTAQVTVNNA